MTCSYCATELPTGAMFCGECGRPVSARLPTSSHPAPVEVITPRELVVPEFPAAPPARPSLDVDPWRDHVVAPVDEELSQVEVEVATPEPVLEPFPIEFPSVEVALEDAVQQAEHGAAWCAQCGGLLAPSDIFCGECGFVRIPASRPGDTVALQPLPPAQPLPGWDAPPTAATPVPGPPAVLPGPAPVDDDESQVDLEQTRIVAPGARGDRFVLQFSTGESVTVTGAGLLGRNPMPEPGEYFDSLVVISDPGKSVSKTHLEFGQEGGAFWVSDRYSGNGTVVREPERPARRCEPGKRYRVARGTRVEIGEQFFVIS